MISRWTQTVQGKHSDSGLLFFSSFSREMHPDRYEGMSKMYQYSAGWMNAAKTLGQSCKLPTSRRDRGSWARAGAPRRCGQRPAHRYCRDCWAGSDTANDVIGEIKLFHGTLWPWRKLNSSSGERIIEESWNRHGFSFNALSHHLPMEASPHHDGGLSSCCRNG